MDKHGEIAIGSDSNKVSLWLADSQEKLIRESCSTFCVCIQAWGHTQFKVRDL